MLLYTHIWWKNMLFRDTVVNQGADFTDPVHPILYHKWCDVRRVPERSSIVPLWCREAPVTLTAYVRLIFFVFRQSGKRGKKVLGSAIRQGRVHDPCIRVHDPSWSITIHHALKSITELNFWSQLMKLNLDCSYTFQLIWCQNLVFREVAKSKNKERPNYKALF